MGLAVGVLAVQGAVDEHLLALRQAGSRLGINVDARAVRTRADLDHVQGLVLPGGESTAISRLLRSAGLHDVVRERAAAGSLAVLGTCAGMVLLSSAASHDVDDKDVRLLGLLDAEVDRNAFGRQRDSFEGRVEVEGAGNLPAVFIRAPVLTRVWGATHALSRVPKGIVVARKGRVLATAFHPELTGDRTIHEWFLRDAQAARPHVPAATSRDGPGPA